MILENKLKKEIFNFEKNNNNKFNFKSLIGIYFFIIKAFFKRVLFIDKNDFF